MNKDKDIALETNRILLHTIRCCDHNIKRLCDLITVSDLFDGEKAFKWLKTESIKRIKFLEHKRLVCKKLVKEINKFKNLKNTKLNVLCVCSKSLIGYDPFMELEELLEGMMKKYEQ